MSGPVGAMGNTEVCGCEPGMPGDTGVPGGPGVSL